MPDFSLSLARIQVEGLLAVPLGEYTKLELLPYFVRGMEYAAQNQAAVRLARKRGLVTAVDTVQLGMRTLQGEPGMEYPKQGGMANLLQSGIPKMVEETREMLQSLAEGSGTHYANPEELQYGVWRLRNTGEGVPSDQPQLHIQSPERLPPERIMKENENYIFAGWLPYTEVTIAPFTKSVRIKSFTDQSRQFEDVSIQNQVRQSINKWDIEDIIAGYPITGSLSDITNGLVVSATDNYRFVIEPF